MKAIVLILKSIPWHRKDISFDTTLGDCLKKFYVIFSKDVKIKGVQERNFGLYFEILIEHSKLELVPEDCEFLRYTIEEAQEKFPFLFKKQL